MSKKQWLAIFLLVIMMCVVMGFTGLVIYGTEVVEPMLADPTFQAIQTAYPNFADPTGCYHINLCLYNKVGFLDGCLGWDHTNAKQYRLSEQAANDVVRGDPRLWLKYSGSEDNFFGTDFTKPHFFDGDC